MDWARDNGIAAAADAHAPFSTWLSQQLDGGSLLHQPPWSSSLNPGRLADAYASTGFRIGVISSTGARRQGRDVADVVACDLLGVPCDCGRASRWSSYVTVRTYETRYDGVAHGMQIAIPRLMHTAGCDGPRSPQKPFGDGAADEVPSVAEVDALIHLHGGVVRCTDLRTFDELLAAFDAPFVTRYADRMLPRWDALAEAQERSHRKYCELDLSVDATWAALRRSAEVRGYNCGDGADFDRWATEAKAAGMQAKAAARQRRETVAALSAAEGAPARQAAAEGAPARQAAAEGAPARQAAATEHVEVKQKRPRSGGIGNVKAPAGGNGEVELRPVAGASFAGPRGLLFALKSGCDPHTPCSLQLQSLARARNVSAARSLRLGSGSGRGEAAAWAQCGPQLIADSPASPASPRVAYVLATSPFVRDEGRGQGPIHGEDVLRMHLLALSTTAAAISRLLLMVPSESSLSDDWEARIMEDYLDIHAEVALLPFPATLVRMPNNTLGSYGMYLAAYAMRRDQFEYYIFAEDDYVPVRPRFDEELVRMYTQTFGERPGVLAGLLQGKPVEPTSPWRLHCESSHIMSASSLRRLYLYAHDGTGRGDGGDERRAIEGGRKHGHIIEHALSLLTAEGICTTATRAATPHCEQTSDSYFDRIQLAFGALLRASNVEARDWTASYRSPYWDHTAVVDWSGASQGFHIPSERVLIAPVQWVFATQVRICCTPFDCIYLHTTDGGKATSCFQPRRSRPLRVQASKREHHPDCCAPLPKSERSLLRLRRNMSVPTTSLLASTSRCAPLEAVALLIEGRTMVPLGWDTTTATTATTTTTTTTTTCINATEGCRHGTHTIGTAYTRGTYSRVHTQTPAVKYIIRTVLCRAALCVCLCLCLCVCVCVYFRVP